MHIHILGICGTFMGGVAVLARQAGHTVSGSDMNVYPPMSTQLEEQGIDLIQGYEPEQLKDEPDQVVVGNAMSRGKPVVEYMMNRNLPYNSGPQWLYENVLRDRWVLAVAGTHGKTTTASMLAWILEYAGLNPGFLIGGIPANFGLSARLGDSPFFVVEADEYDTAFFDKRSKFVHYHPRTLIMNNLEFDHADIFENLDAIKKQFHHLVRTIPGEGLIISNADEENLDTVLQQGCWTPTEKFSASSSNSKEPNGWSTRLMDEAGTQFEVLLAGEVQGVVSWSMIGAHNRSNALAAIAAARHAGVPVKQAIDALAEFKGVKRRQEVIGQINEITVYDDFAHHPTAIEETLQGLRQRVGQQRIITVLEPRSNTMRMGVHKALLAASLEESDQIFLYQPAEIDWALDDVISELGDKARLFNSVDAMIMSLLEMMKPQDHIMIMSNGGFEGLHQRLLLAMEAG